MKAQVIGAIISGALMSKLNDKHRKKRVSLYFGALDIQRYIWGVLWYRDWALKNTGKTTILDKSAVSKHIVAMMFDYLGKHTATWYLSQNDKVILRSVWATYTGIKLVVIVVVLVLRGLIGRA